MNEQLHNYLSNNRIPINQLHSFFPRLHKGVQYQQPILGMIICIDLSGQWTNIGSAVMISPNLIVTAASNIYNRKLGPIFRDHGLESTNYYPSTFENFLFHPTMESQINEQRVYKIQCWRYPSEFADQQCKNPLFYDFALMKLIQKIEYPQQLFPIPTFLCSECLASQKEETNVLLFGYHQKYLLEQLSEAYFSVKGQQYHLIKCKIQQLNSKNYFSSLYDTFDEKQYGDAKCKCLVFYKNRLIGFNIEYENWEVVNRCKLFNFYMIYQLELWANQMGESMEIQDKQVCFHAESESQQSLAKIHFQLGEQENYKQNRQEAVKNYTKAIQLNPNFYKAYIQRGKMNFLLSNQQNGFRDYLRAILINPYCIEAYQSRAYSFYSLKDYKNAIRDYEKVLKIDPKNSNAAIYKELAIKNINQCSVNNIAEKVIYLKVRQNTLIQFLRHRNFQI